MPTGICIQVVRHQKGVALSNFPNPNPNNPNNNNDPFNQGENNYTMNYSTNNQPNNINEPFNQGESNYIMKHNNNNNNPFRQFKLSEIEGFIGLQDMLADNEVMITDRVMQYEGETLIVLGGIYKVRRSVHMQNAHDARVSIDMLLGYGEGTIVHCSMQWWTRNGEFLYRDAYDEEYGYWCENQAWPSNLRKEVELFVSSDGVNPSPALRGQCFPCNTTDCTDPIKWIQWTFEDAQRADNYFQVTRNKP
jgi:hypothetical protein